MRRLPPGLRHIRRPPRRGPEWTRWLGVGLVAIAVQVASDPDYPIPRRSAPVSSAHRQLPPLVEAEVASAAAADQLEFRFAVRTRGGTGEPADLREWRVQFLTQGLEPIGEAAPIRPTRRAHGVYRVLAEELGAEQLEAVRAAGGGFWMVEARWHRPSGADVGVGSGPVPLRITE